jgi:threonine dehydrogenase-like Zn-dependent dehydrogenase
MACYSAILCGASRVYSVDMVPERLAQAEKIGCIPIDFTKGDPVDAIIKHNDGNMVDRAVDAVGYQAVDKGGKKEQPNVVLENLIRVTRPCGGLGIPGLYVPTDPGAPDKLSGEGQILMPFGKLFEKVNFLFHSCLLLAKPLPSFLPSPLSTITRSGINANIGSLSRNRPMQRQSLQPLPP